MPKVKYFWYEICLIFNFTGTKGTKGTFGIESCFLLKRDYVLRSVIL